MTEARSFPEAANGLPQAPMEAELWAAGCDLETARFVAKQLERDGFVLIKPRQLWAAHKHFEGERKFALRQIVKWLGRADQSGRSNVAHLVERHDP
jgi:hypothetical protein